MLDRAPLEVRNGTGRSRLPLRTRSVALIVAAISLYIACGKKGPPLPPMPILPARIEDLAARRVASEVYLRFTVPIRNQTGSTPANIEQVEVYALTGDLRGPLGRSVDERDFVRYGTLVERIDIKPPPPEEATPEAPPASTIDPRPAQGDSVVVREELTPSTMTPFRHPRLQEAATPEQASRVERVVRALAWPTAEPLLVRTYIAVGVTRNGRRGPHSPRIGVPLGDTPPVPSAPVVTYTETAFDVSWTAPSTARRPIQEAATEGLLPAQLLVPVVPPHAYNVYAWSANELPKVVADPLNPIPLSTTGFVISPLTFGVERCFVIRTIEVAGLASRVESPPSAPQCVTPIDSFPPAPPQRLAAVASEGAVSLIWEANSEADFAGYVVLRSEEGRGVWQPLNQTPMTDTTYRDATVVPGTRYVYAVVAVDNAAVPNTSAHSNEVAETAR